MSGGRAATHPALQARRRDIARARARRRRTVALGLLAGAVCVAGAWFLLTGPLLAVSDVTLENYDRDDAAQLEAALESAASSGTALRPAVGDVRKAASVFPWVESVDVERDLPRGLVVRVTPAEPVAVVRAPDGPAMLVSESGRILGPAEEGTGLPSLRLSKAAPETGGWLPRASAASLAFVGALDDETAARVRKLSTRRGQLVGALANGTELRLGAPDRLTAKAAALTAVLDHLSAEEEAAATHIDVSVPERPSVGGLEPATEPTETADPAAAAATATDAAAPTDTVQ